MISPSKQEQLRRLIDEQQERIRQTFPDHSGSAALALTRAKDWQYLQSRHNFITSDQNTIPASFLRFSGWHKALQFCFGKTTTSPFVAPIALESTLDAWADQVLLECDCLTAGEQVLTYCDIGFMRMQQGGGKDFSAWIASKSMPTEWREREDLTWWTNMLIKTYKPEILELIEGKAFIQRQTDLIVNHWQPGSTAYKTTQEIDDYYHRLGILLVKTMKCQFLYPDQTLLGGCTVELYKNVLSVLIGWALKHLDLCRAYITQYPSYSLRSLFVPPYTTTLLIEALSETLGVDRASIHRVINAYSLSHENVFHHCSAPGTPVPPLIRLDEQHLVWSFTGLLSEPLLFLIRELKRRDSYKYHTASRLHEEVFRHDLYQLFSDKRFVRSAGNIVLRGVQGDLITDIDALVFDRKTGALALFELKSQDPFAYSLQERRRQRDYFYSAGKQVLACVQWLNRNGADALLTRLDPKLVKRLKVQKTYIFVLGRYLAHFFDGPAFDQRAAWGTWSQVLQLIHEMPSGTEDTHLIQSLYNKLTKDTPLTLPSSLLDVQKITIGESNVYIYPDFRTYTGKT